MFGRAIAVTLAFVAVALAGCSSHGAKSGASDAPAPDFQHLDLAATATTGVIRGVVVDSAVRPLANATVSLIDPPVKAVTTETGAFGFDDLQPGTYFLTVTKLGYLSVQQSTEVVAGVSEPPIVKVQLVADANFKLPYFEQFVFDGFIECSGGAGAGGGYVYYSACSNDVNGQPLFPNDHFAYEYVISGYPTYVQDEMVWQSTQALSTWLSHSFYYDDPDELDGEKDLSVDGPSPILNTMDNLTAKQYVEGLNYENGTPLMLRARIFTVATDGTGPALTVQQRFSIYTTIFYGYLPPVGWLLADGNGVPPPPT